MKKKLILIAIVATMSLSVGCFNSEAKENIEDTTEAENIEDTTEVENIEDTTDAIEVTELEKVLNENGELFQYSTIQEGEDIATIKTNYGDIKVRFFKDKAPKAVENFLTHAKDGYYDGVIFHRVIEDFMVQGGDPLGTGTGGESIWGEGFENEISTSLRHFTGALSMANTGQPNSNGSQFFIVQSSGSDDAQKEQFETLLKSQEDIIEGEIKVKDMYPEILCEKYIETGGASWLDGAHTVFGQVYEGMDIVNNIAKVKKGENDKPLEDIIIETIEVSTYK